MRLRLPLRMRMRNARKANGESKNAGAKHSDTAAKENRDGQRNGVQVWFILAGNEEVVSRERLANSPAYKHKHVGYCLHVKASTAAAASALAALFCWSLLQTPYSRYGNFSINSRVDSRQVAPMSPTANKQSVIPKSLIDFQQVASSAGLMV